MFVSETTIEWQSIQLTQLSLAQLELHELQAHNDALHDQVLASMLIELRMNFNCSELFRTHNMNMDSAGLEDPLTNIRGLTLILMLCMNLFDLTITIINLIVNLIEALAHHTSNLMGEGSNNMVEEELEHGSFTISAPTPLTSHVQPIASTSCSVFEAHQPQQSMPPHWTPSPQVTVTLSTSGPTNFVITPCRTHDGISINIKTPTQSCSNTNV